MSRSDHGHADKKIATTVVTTADDLSDNFNTRQPLRVVFQRALTLVATKAGPISSHTSTS